MLGVMYSKVVLVRRYALCLILLLSASAPVSAGGIPMEVKAAFLYNFTKFIVWPSSALENADRFQLCVAGSLVDVRQIEQVIAGKPTGVGDLNVRFISERRELSGCHMLYSSTEKHYRTEGWLKEAVKLPVVTVGESEEFIARGGIIGLILVEGKVRFVINEARAREQGIVISSKLLSLAQRVVR